VTRPRFLPYPSYKNSGVEWLGRIPDEWEARQTRFLFRTVNGATPSSSEPDYWNGDIAWATPDDLGALDGDILRATARCITRVGYDSCGTTLVPPGSLVVSTRAPIGYVAIAGRELCTNQGCRCLVVRAGVEARFYYYALLAGGTELQSWGQGSTFLELSKGKLQAIRLPVPLALEQLAMAAFLDRETQRIDALVEKKERLVELLQEKRTALISHAVTKGLDPNVRLKDTGVEWLGRIPVHWEYSRVGHLILSTNAGEVIDKSYWHDGDELLFTCQKTPVRSWFSPFPDWKRTKTGDVLLTRNGTPYAFLPPADAIYTNVVQRVRLHPRCRPEFAFLVLNQAADTMRGFGDIIESFNMGVWRETWLPLPSADEQNRIVAFLDRETRRIDAMVEKVRRSIELLKEYRTAIISAAVTGKIDVREEACGD
jgi:type I restriction enzyme S subunit